jgi:hypothetical protein
MQRMFNFFSDKEVPFLHIFFAAGVSNPIPNPSLLLKQESET